MITVRPASESDGAALARIDLATWTAATSPAPPPADVGSYLFFENGAAPSDVLTADVDGVVAGYVRVRHPTLLPSNAHVLEVGGLAVDPARQGAGVGRHLVEAAVMECIRREARKLTLRVLGSNVGALRLYERCGFVIEGVLRAEFLLGGHYVDDVLMARHLSAPVP